MSLKLADLIVIAGLIIVGFATCYILLLYKLRAILTDRQLKIADQIGALDDAIHTLETRLAEHHAQPTETIRVDQYLDRSAKEAQEANSADQEEASGEITPEVQAAIAAAAVATLGPNAVVHSLKPVPSPWTQQGRVLVQGGHNLRLRR